VSFSPDSSRIATCSQDGTVKLWDTRTGKVLHNLAGFKGEAKAAFSPDSARIVTGDGLGAKVWDARTGTHLFDLKGRPGTVLSVAFSPDAKRIVTAGYRTESPTEQRAEATVWDARTGTALFDLKGHARAVFRVSFTPDATRIVTRSYDWTTRVWDARSGKELVNEPIPITVEPGPVTPDGRLFACNLGNRVLLISLKPTAEETAYRLLHTRPNHRRYREGYVAARTAKDDFATRFYRNLLTAAQRKAADGQVDQDRFARMMEDAEAHSQNGKWDQAAKVFMELWNLQKARLGPEDQETLETMDHLGVAYWNMRRFDKSIPLFRELVKIGEKKLGADHALTIYARANLGVNLRDAGQLEEAIPLLEKAREAARKDPELTFVTNQLVVVYTKAGQHGKAATILVELWNHKKATLGPEDQGTLETMNHLGVVYWEMRRFDKSIPLFRELLKSRAKKLGADHARTMHDGANLAANLQDAGQIEEAIPLLQKAHEAAKKDTELSFATDRLIEAYARVGQPGKAATILLDIWDLQKSRLGREHADTLDTMTRLGVAYWQMRQFDKSIPLFRELLKIRAKNLGADHARTIHAGANLGVNLRDAGQFEEAIPLLEKAHEAAKRHPALGWVTNQLIDAYSTAGQHGKASSLGREYLAEARKQLPRNSPQLAGLLAQIGLGLLEQQKGAEAEPLLRECLAIREKAWPDAWQTFNSKALLGRALLGQKKYAEAEPLLLAGYQGMKKRQDKVPPAGKPRLKEAVQRLVQLYEETDRKDEAAKWRKELEAIQAANKKPNKQP
jgi:tetratricopeptide (TPR) repeat protein